MYLGQRGVTHGDFNGDGFDDLFFGNTQTVGAAFVVFGRAAGGWNSFNITEIESGSVPGFAVTGNLLTTVGNAGDVNSDGIDDLFASNTQDAFVIFGMAGVNRESFNVSTVDGMNGFLLVGESCSGFGMGSAGDVNGDGFADLALGSYSAASNAGHSFILFARNTSSAGQQWPALFNLSTDIDGTNGFIVDGGQPYSYFGHTVVGAGDVNSDGFSDLFVGSLATGKGACVIFGHSAPWTFLLNTSQLDGTNGFCFADTLSGTFGYSGGGAGDVNGDGFDDVLIGGFEYRNSSGAKIGATAIVFGHRGVFLSEISSSSTAGDVGFVVEGPSFDSKFGFSARSAGDVNGDGLADVVIGAYNHQQSAGYVLLVFGADDHCAVCSNSTTDDCLVCDDGFINNGSVCKSNQTGAASSSATSAVVVVIETDGGGTAIEVAAEVAQLLGVDVGQISVVEITPGTFEVTVINEEIAQQLVTLIEQCMEEV